MNLIAFVNRPVMATAVNLVLLIIGLVSYYHLELKHKPTVQQNEIRIVTAYPGGNRQVIEQQITKPIEDSLSGLDGIKKLTSVSSDGQSQIFIKFQPGSDNTKILSQVRDRVFGNLSSLPESVKRPEIQEETESSPPILYLAFEDNTQSVAALSDYLRRTVEDRLRLIEGVASLERFGDKLYQVVIEPDPALLIEKKISIKDIVTALQKEKSFASGGEIENVTGKEAVVIKTGIDKPEGFGNISIKNTKQGRIAISDVAKVYLAEKPTYLNLRVDGTSVVGLSVKTKPQANPLLVAERVTQFVHELQKSMPTTMKGAVVFDATKPFKASFASLKRTLWEAILLVGIIVTLSLGSLRAAILPVITIPLCLIGSFALMWGFGFSLNPITLLALVLAVGLVVDDAIVVVENIHRHMENGLSALNAARKGMKEISFAIIVMTITLAAVYLPVAFQTDESAIMFREFAWTLAGSVLISGFVALTLTPALCGKFLKDSKHLTLWDTLNSRYSKSLKQALQYPKMICSLLLVVLLLGVWGYNRLPSELLPIEDDDMLMGEINFSNSVAEPIRLSWLKEIEKLVETLPEKEHIFSGIWQDTWVFWQVLLKPRDERSRGAQDIITELQPKLQKIVGPAVSVRLGEGGLDTEESLKVIIQYAADEEQIVKLVKAIIEEAETQPGFLRLHSEQTWEKPRVNVILDRKLADELGVSIDTIEDTLYTYLSGKKAANYYFQGLDYDVLVRANPKLRSDWEGINTFFVQGAEEQWVPLGNLVTLKEILEPNQIKHYERMRGAAITIHLKPEMHLDKAINILEPIIKKHLPREAHYRFGGKAEKYKEAQNSLWLTFALALVFIYLVLSALFESFIHPLVVLLTVPLSITGAVWAINFMGGTNNLYTGIGLITLIGLITKHGILIVDFSNRLRESGMALHEAVVQAATARLRPVLMTTLAMIFGAIPLVFGVTEGALARKHIGWVIIGGMISGTLFSLYIVPVVYSLIARGSRVKVGAGSGKLIEEV